MIHKIEERGCILAVTELDGTEYAWATESLGVMIYQENWTASDDPVWDSKNIFTVQLDIGMSGPNDLVMKLAEYEEISLGSLVKHGDLGSSISFNFQCESITYNDSMEHGFIIRAKPEDVVQSPAQIYDVATRQWRTNPLASQETTVKENL